MFRFPVNQRWSCECGASGSHYASGKAHLRSKPLRCLVSLSCQFCGKENKLTPSAIRNGKRGFCGDWCGNQFRQKTIPDLALEFEAAVLPEPNSGCWLWAGQIDTHGYGVISVRHRYYKATHLALALDGRPISGGLVACHKCDVPSCVNPKHLFAGTKKQNTLDARAKGRLKPGGRPFAP